MIFITKFNTKLFGAARPVVLAAQRGDVGAAMRGAPGLILVAQTLEAEASRKAATAFVSGNDQVYASMAFQAQSFAQAAALIAGANRGGGKYDEHAYQRGVAALSAAVSGS